jgi:hypothetical protein
MDVGSEYDDCFGRIAERTTDTLFRHLERHTDGPEALRCEFYDTLIFFAANVLEIENKKRRAAIIEWFFPGLFSSMWPLKKKSKITQAMHALWNFHCSLDNARAARTARPPSAELLKNIRECLRLMLGREPTADEVTKTTESFIPF